jgi:hypothetical protein
LDLACVKAFRELRGVARVIGAEVKGSEIRLTSVEGAVARGGEWRRLPADPSARIELIDAWVAELFDAYGWVVVRVPGSVAGARVTVGGRACTTTSKRRSTESGAGAGSGSGMRLADVGLSATDGPGPLRRRGGDLLPDAIHRCRARPGRTIVTVEAPGKVAFRHELKVQPWVENEIVARLVDIVGPAAPPLLTTRVSRTHRSPALLWTSIGLAAAGVGLGIAGVVNGVNANGWSDTFNSAQGALSSDAELALLQKRNLDLQRRDIFWVTSGVTFAGALVTAIVYVVGTKRVIVIPSANGVSVMGGF